MTTVASSDDSFDIHDRLKQRLETTKLQKDQTQTRIQQLNNELTSLFNKIPKKPRESMTEMDDKINALEFKRQTQSMDLADEKLILREISGISRTKNQLEGYNLYERKVQEVKSQLSDLREGLKTKNAAIDELEAALSKVKLANKLGCTAAELKHLSVDVPADKIGRIIGKSGSTIKQLEETCKVTMDVDSVSGKINLTGAEHSLAAAIMEVDKITMAIDEDIQVPVDLLNYFTTKRIKALQQFRTLHPEVQIEAYRDKKIVSLRGPQLAVMAAKGDLLQISLASETRILVGRESSIIVGKSGSTINRLVEKHQVSISVNETGDDVFAATICGPAERVEAAVAEIDIVMAANKDVVEEIVVDQIVRNTFLNDNGAPIKALQKEVNDAAKEFGGFIQLSFQKGQKGASTSKLLIKGRRASVDAVQPLVEAVVEKVKSSVVTIEVDPFIVPKIIGKGGETIKKIKAGKPVNIEVDKSSGRVVIQAQDDDEVKRVEAEINQIVLENFVKRIALSPSTAKSIFRELVRSDKKTEINDLVWMGLDDDAGAIILRGTEEDVGTAAALVDTFVAENYVEEVEISAEDEPTLLAGGSDSQIQSFQTEFGAELAVVRSRYVVIVKGAKANVQAAVRRLKQFLHGGDGYTVSRISVTDQALGVVIGKGGSKRAELEKNHEGVTIFIHRSNRITIRGPEEAVEACRVDIIRLVSSVKVQQVLPLTPEQREILNKGDALRRATNGIPVQVNVNEDSVKIRGIYQDVRDAKAMLSEVITGAYVARVELESSQLACVRGACRDPSHFQRMQETTNAEVKLDISTNSVVITGKRSNVRKAKNLVVSFLEFVLPSDFNRLKISKPLQTTVGEAAALADVAAVSGASVWLDRDLSSILIQSSDPEKVKKASEILKEKIDSAEKKAFVTSFEASESWLIPLIIGKGGNRVNSLRMESGCNIDINKVERTVTVTGDDEAGVAKAREILNKMTDEARRQCIFVDLPKDSTASFVGRGGSHIRQFSTDNKVEVERMRKDPTKVKITGEEENVTAAKKALDAWIEHWVARQAGQTITIDKSSIPVVLGKGGSVIIALQNEFGCKVEINREDLTLTVRGATEELRGKAMEKINQIIAEDQDRHRQKHEEKEEGEERKTAPTNNRDSKAREKQSGTDMGDRKDRTGEFAARPVGLTIVESHVQSSKKRNRNRKPQKDISDDSTLQVGSSAGRSLFNLLVSEEQQQKITDERASTGATTSLMVNEDPWDSSTVSSAAVDSTDQDDEAGRNGKPYIKSASGFTVRV